jgi:alkylhydroperoxidase/carboxymuconolactone decarboxylase family protein YurZ
MSLTPNSNSSLSAPHKAIVPIAALAAAGDLSRLGDALNSGLDAGLSVNDIKEVLTQLYAYAGFPRSLNAMAELMKQVQARKDRGISDMQGAPPVRAIPTGTALLAAGTANQTRIVGFPVAGPLFEFAPAVDQFLKTHLFGDIFERDNLDWQTRELATLGMLSVIEGADAQLQAHMGFSMNVGISEDQLHQLLTVLSATVSQPVADRAQAALTRALAARTQ